jgi:hypothetical protein
MDTPTREFANHLKSNVMQGIETRGNLAMVVQVRHPHDVGTQQGVTNGVPASRGTRGDPLLSSNTVMGGVVQGYITDNDSIRKAYLIARNLYSPTAHPSDANRLAASSKIVYATKPTKDIRMPKKIGRGTGGNYTIPMPQVVPQWPTSSEWLAKKLRGRF